MVNFFISLLFLAILGIAKSQFNTCPSSWSIAPCSCTAYDGKGSLYCRSPSLGQGLLDRIFAICREVNGLGPDDWLPVSTFRWEDALMTTMDLTPFSKVHITYMSIIYNLQLQSFTGPPLNTTSSSIANSGIIRADNLYLVSNALTTEGFGHALKYFDPTFLKVFQIDDNELTEFPRSMRFPWDDPLEFLPGLSTFTGLRMIEIGQNQIKTVGPKSFFKNNQMTHLALNSMRGIVFEDDAFLIENPSAAMNETLNFDLRFNNLSHTNFFPTKNGLDQIRERKVKLDLSWNLFETLLSESFLTFVDDAKQGNRMQTDSNEFFCDSRMLWLKKRKQEFQNRIYIVRCANDDGEMVYDSDLVG